MNPSFQSSWSTSPRHCTAPALAHLLANQPDVHQLAASAMTMITTFCQYLPEEMPALDKLDHASDHALTATWHTHPLPLTVTTLPDGTSRHTLPQDQGDRSPRTLSHRSTAFSNAARRVLIARMEPPQFPPDNPPPKDSDILLTLGRRHRQARLHTGMTQNALGTLIGYKQHMISHVERGLYGMPWQQTIRVTALLNISLDYLAGRPSPRQQETPSSPDNNILGGRCQRRRQR